MSLDGNVIPGVLAACQALVAGPSSGQATMPGALMSVHLGEQWRVSGRGPVAWVLMADADEPEEMGSGQEFTNWVIEVRFLVQFAPAQRHAEEVLMALIEPFRAVLRTHTKLFWTAPNSPTGADVNVGYTGIARARFGGARWLYIVVNKVTYRMVSVRVLVSEKVPVLRQTGG